MNYANYTPQYIDYHKIIDFMRSVQLASPRLQSFGHGDIVYFSQTLTGGTATYPYMFVTPMNVSYAENTTQYQLNVIFGDIVNTDLSNEIDVVSDMSLEARNLLSQIWRGSLFNDIADVQLPTNAVPFLERFNDHVGGVSLDLVITVMEDMNACPMYDLPVPTETPICETPTPTPDPTTTPTTTPTQQHPPTSTPNETPTNTPTNTGTPTNTPTPTNAASITYVTNSYYLGFQSSYTFSGVSIGGPGLIVIPLNFTTSFGLQSISSVLVNGASATIAIQINNGGGGIEEGSALAYIRVNSGTTADIQVNFTGNADQLGIATYRILNNISDTPIQSVSAIGVNPSVSFSGSQTNSLIIATSTNSANTSFSGVSTDYTRSMTAVGTRYAKSGNIITNISGSYNISIVSAPVGAPLCSSFWI
jgi:hypothetical protein